MNRRRVALGGCLLIGLAVFGLALAVWWMTPTPRITPAVASRIQPDMSRDAVEHLLGRQAADASREEAVTTAEDGSWLGPTKTWAGSRFVLHVQFDGNGRVLFNQTRPTQASLLDTFRRWLHL